MYFSLVRFTLICLWCSTDTNIVIQSPFKSMTVVMHRKCFESLTLTSFSAQFDLIYKHKHLHPQELIILNSPTQPNFCGGCAKGRPEGDYHPKFLLNFSPLIISLFSNTKETHFLETIWRNMPTDCLNWTYSGTFYVAVFSFTFFMSKMYFKKWDIEHCSRWEVKFARWSSVTRVTLPSLCNKIKFWFLALHNGAKFM